MLLVENLINQNHVNEREAGRSEQLLGFFKAELKRDGEGKHGLLAGLIVVLLDDF